MRIVHPYENLTGGKWLRGNLHTHTTRSDGRLQPQAVVDRYAKLGYDFLALSDHDVQSTPDDYATIDSHGITLIPGNEVTANGPHMLHINGTKRVEPSADRQKVIDDALASGGFVIANHPNWGTAFNHVSTELLKAWNGYVGLEVYNSVCSWLPGSPYAADRWDLLLSAGRRVWGYANDDFHGIFEKEMGRGFNMVYAPSNSIGDIVSALVNGRCYASTGVIIKNIQVNGTTIRIARCRVRHARSPACRGGRSGPGVHAAG
jgi:hypothetical protein